MTDHPTAERVTEEPADSPGGDSAAGPGGEAGAEVVAEVLVEEVSIDGMCGVY
jgi:mycofactocin precursor